MKTVAFFIDNLARSGTELQLIGLINALKPHVNIHLYTLRESDPELIPQGIIHHFIPVKKLKSWKTLRVINTIRHQLQNDKVDVVQCFFQDATIIGLIGAKLAGVPVRIACFRDLGFWITPLQDKIFRCIYRLATHYICNAKMVANYFTERFTLAPNKVDVIPNGVDADRLPFNPPREPQHIGLVGNMTRQVKRVDLLIKAAALLKPRYPALTWHIIGDGHLKAELETLAKSLDIADNIIFAGRVSDIPQYLKTIDIGLITSDSEGLSNAIIEYMFSGVTVIATRVGGNPELIEHQHTGLLVPPNDAAALAEAIDELISHPIDRKKYTFNARHMAETSFTWNICLTRHLAIYSNDLTPRKDNDLTSTAQTN